MGTDAPKAIPNPATPAAKALGCNCPTQDGKGHRVRMNCPVHGMQPVLRQKTSAERKAEPIHSGPMSYHPDALAAHARLCVAGNTKHNGPGTPLSWARGKSNDHLECAARHMLTPDAIDPETGETELTAAFWRLGCALQLQQERLLKEKGIMPYSGITP